MNRGGLQDSTAKAAGIAWTGAGILLLLALLVSFAPPAWRTWGLDAFAYYSPVTRLILAAGMIATSILLALFLGRLPADSGRTVDAGWFPTALPLLVGLLVLLFPAATFLRGDGQLLMNHLYINDPASFRSPLYARLVGFVFHIGTPFGLTPRGTYITVDLLAALLYAGAIIRYSRRFTSTGGALFSIILLLFTGTLPLLFGLVEHYALVHAILAWALVFSLESLERGRFPWIGLFLVLVAAGFHVSASIFLPAFVLAAVYRRFGGRTAWIVFFLLLVLAAVPAVLLLKRHLLAPLGDPADDGYSLFALRHILDLVNLDFWSVPLLVAVGLPALFAIPSVPALRAGEHFLLASTAGAIGFAFVFSPDLGMARDADLLALYALPATLWTLQLWRRSRMAIPVALPAAALLAGLATVGVQVAVQADEERARERFIRQLKVDPERSAYGYEVLGIHYRSLGEQEKEEQAYRMAVRYEREEARYYVQLARLTLERGAVEEARCWCDTALAIDSIFALAYGIKGKVMHQLGQDTEADSLFHRAIELQPSEGSHYANYAAFLLASGHREKAEEVLEEGISVAEPNPQLMYVYGVLQEELGDRRKAMAAYDKASRINPGGPWGKRALEAHNRLFVTPAAGR